MTTRLCVAELAATHELDLGASSWRPVEQLRVDTFAEATDDHQWIHVDAERAASGPFGTTIAHGYLTLALVPSMLEELLSISDQIRSTNYGLERIRFVAPVHVGRRIRLAARIGSVSRRGDGGVQYRVTLCVEIEAQARPAMVGESTYLSYG